MVPENLAGHFLYGMDASITRTVIVNGNVVYEEGEFPFDTAEIYAESRKQAKMLWEKMETIAP